MSDNGPSAGPPQASPHPLGGQTGVPVGRGGSTSYLDWPFFEPRHAALARELDAWATEHLAHAHGDDVDAECRGLVRSLGGEEAERWGFLNRLVEPGKLVDEAMALARDLAAGPTFANGITKTMLHQEWAMTIEQAIEAEAQAQAICMLTEDFTRAYEAFAAKQRPVFEGN